MTHLSNPFFLALKAALSSALAYALVSRLGIYDTLSAPFVALACTSPVVLVGLRQGAAQLFAAAVGGGAALAVLAVLPDAALALGLAMFVTLYAVHRLGLHDVFLVAGFTVIYAYLLPDITADFAVEHRMMSLAVGVVSATIVNVVVSAGAYRKIFERRRKLVRAQVVEALERLVAATRTGESAPHAFDDIFPVMWKLGGELGGAMKEGRWRPSVQVQLEDLNEAVRLMALLCHLGKELGLLASVSDAQAKAMHPHLAALAAQLSRNAPEPTLPPQEEWTGAMRRAFDTCRRLLEVEERLEGKPRQ